MRVASVNGKKYTRLCPLFTLASHAVKVLRTDNGTEFVNQTLREYYEKIGISHETSIARSPQQNSVVERRNRTLIEAARTMLIYAMASSVISRRSRYFDELTTMASELSSSGPALHEMTPATISSGLVPDPPPSTPFVPPSRTDWDILFQPLFDELLTPPPSVDLPAPEVIDLNNSQTTPETQPPVIPNDVEEDNHDIEVAHMGNDPYFANAKDNPLENLTGELDVDQFLQDELGGILKNKARLVAHGYRQEEGIDFPKAQWILLCSSVRKARNYFCFDSCDPVDTPMVEKSKLAEDKEEKAVDLSHYCGMIGTLLYLTATLSILLRGTSIGDYVIEDSSHCTKKPLADADHAGCQDTRRRTSGSMQFLKDRLVSWSSKRQKSAAISSTEAEYIAIIMSITKEQQQALDDALVPREQRLTIGSCNYRLSTTFKPKEPTFQVALDVLSLTPFYPAFLITASVPAVYMQEF
ncbi:uncharacterized mitochondrial protein-like protein [Tanacetum coccineum]